MTTLTINDIASFRDRYLQLRETAGSELFEGNPALLNLENEWRQRAPRSKPLSQVIHITSRSPDPQGYWQSIMRQNGYTVFGYPFQRHRTKPQH